MRRHCAAFSFFFAATMAVAASPAKSSLTLEEVLKSVKARFPSLEAARQDAEAAAADVLSAEGGFDLNWRSRASSTTDGYYPNRRLDTVIEKPTALWGTTFFTGYRLGAGDFAIYDGKFETQSGGEIRAGLEVPLIRNGPIDRRRATLWRAEAGQKIANFNVDSQALESLRTAAHRYWDWVAAEHKVRIMQGLLELATTRDSQLQKRAAHGDIPRIEVEENVRAILQREAQLVSATRLMEQAAIELSLYLRDTSGTQVNPTSAMAPVDFPDARLPDGTSSDDTLGQTVSAAQAQRPDVPRIGKMREQNDFEKRWARNQILPRLDAQFIVSKDLGQPETKLKPTEVEGALVIEIPLQTRVASGRLAAANANLLKLDAQERLALDRIANEVRDSIIGMRAARERIGIAHKEVVIAERLEKAERTRFQNGDSSLLFVNIREQFTADARLKEIDAQQDFFKAVALFKAAKGDASL
jgi:outer membrane protein TolC